MQDNISQCENITRSSNVTFFEGGLYGIPENMVINFTLSSMLLMLFCIVKAISWYEQNQHLRIYTNGWITLLYRDAWDLMGPAELEAKRSIYKPLDSSMSYFRMVTYSLFKLTNEELLERCGVDALQYIRFLKCSITYNVINTFIMLICILPANSHGSMRKGNNYFVRTTMDNLDFRNCNLLWVHISVSLFLMIASFFIIRNFSSGLVVYKRHPWAAKSVYLKETGNKPMTSERIQKYINDILPGAEIEDIKFVYKYNVLIRLNRKLKEETQALQICKYIMDVEKRSVYAKQCCWCCKFWCKMPCGSGLENAAAYYENKLAATRISIAKELGRLPEKSLRTAFVTLGDPRWAKIIRTEDRFPDVEDDINWKISKASDPANIIWENLSRRGSNFKFKTLFINTAVLIVAIFVTTPAFIISSSQLDSIQKNLIEVSPYVRFIPSLVSWLCSIAIPALVTYSSGFLDFETKSGLNRSIMIKTVLFLVFAIVILPSLGLTSISAFVIWTIEEADHVEYKWACIFLPDNGAFFVSYVMTSAFIGNVIQLLRLGEVFCCVVGVLMAKSEAEKIPIRKSNVWDFYYGVQYSYSLLIFTVVLFFSLMCPIIAPFGLVYFVLKLFVDRYNLYFCYLPSASCGKVHSLAIQFMMFAVILKHIGLFFLMYIRGGWLPVTYASLAILCLTLAYYSLSMNVFCLKKVPKWILMPHKSFYKTYKEDGGANDKGIYQPFALRKYSSILPPVDRYENLTWASEDQDFDIEEKGFMDYFYITD